jgi:dihydroorotate dehydrogenase (NAD+) catalytic subunit
MSPDEIIVLCTLIGAIVLFISEKLTIDLVALLIILALVLGGVLTWQDAAEFILVGASAVGVGTALFVDPRKPVELAHGLAAWLREQRASRVADLVGAMEG